MLTVFAGSERLRWSRDQPMLDRATEEKKRKDQGTSYFIFVHPPFSQLISDGRHLRRAADGQWALAHPIHILTKHKAAPFATGHATIQLSVHGGI